MTCFWSSKTMGKNCSRKWDSKWETGRGTSWWPTTGSFMCAARKRTKCTGTCAKMGRYSRLGSWALQPPAVWHWFHDVYMHIRCISWALQWRCRTALSGTSTPVSSTLGRSPTGRRGQPGWTRSLPLRWSQFSQQTLFQSLRSQPE